MNIQEYNYTTEEMFYIITYIIVPRVRLALILQIQSKPRERTWHNL